MAFIAWAEHEKAAVEVILNRACAADPQIDREDLLMSLNAVHAQIGLDLEWLASTDDFNCSHDVNGILQHIDRPTEKINPAIFLPRAARGPREQ